MYACTQLPVYITDLAITGLDGAKHAYELEKFLRIAFSHPAVAGIDLADLWDEGNALPSSGLYSVNKTPKPAALALERLWREEWHTSSEKATRSRGGGGSGGGGSGGGCSGGGSSNGGSSSSSSIRLVAQ